VQHHRPQITQHWLTLTDEQWLQTFLPINVGGLGVRKMSSLALRVYLASAASTGSLQNTILDAVTTSGDKMFGAYLSKWQSISSAVLPLDPLPTKQSFWDSPGISQARQQVGE